MGYDIKNLHGYDISEIAVEKAKKQGLQVSTELEYDTYLISFDYIIDNECFVCLSEKELLNIFRICVAVLQTDGVLFSTWFGNNAREWSKTGLSFNEASSIIEEYFNYSIVGSMHRVYYNPPTDIQEITWIGALTPETLEVKL